MKQCGKFVSQNCIQATTFIYLQIFIFRLHLNVSSFMAPLFMQHLSLLFPGSLLHCFLCSASGLTSRTPQQFQAVFLTYPLSHSHSTAPVVLSSPSPLQKFLSSLSPCPRGNSLLTGGCRNGAAGFSFRHPSTTVCVFGCVFCLFVWVTDARQLASVTQLTHDSSLNFFSRKSCKWRSNYTV